MNLRRVASGRAWTGALAIGIGVLFATPARGRGALDGVWDGPAGPTRIVRHGTHVVGTLARPSAACGLPVGARVLDADLLLGNLTGRLRLCTPGCASGRAHWGIAMLVRRGDRLAGAVHVAAGRCKAVGRSAKGGVVLERAHRRRAHARHRRRDATAAHASAAHASAAHASAAHASTPRGPAAPAGAGPPPGTYDPRHAGEARSKAMDIARAGLDLLEHGRFEAARKRFRHAVAVDPHYAEGYNGIGVTYAMRRDWKRAVSWYQRSIAADPDIGDAYYNLACAYAQTRRPVLAVRYLRLAVLNGYSQIKQVEADPDLRPLRGRADYRAVLALGGATAHPRK